MESTNPLEAALPQEWPDDRIWLCPCNLHLACILRSVDNEAVPPAPCLNEVWVKSCEGDQK